MEGNKHRKTCEERIDEELKGRLEQFLPDVRSWSENQCREWLKTEGREVPETGDLAEAVLEAIREHAGEHLLDLETITTFRLCLSWGGPADYFELDWSIRQSAWTGGRYLFQDWFDGAQRRLSDEQVARLADLFGIDPELN